jgi:hypothetical protein
MKRETGLGSKTDNRAIANAIQGDLDRAARR